MDHTLLDQVYHRQLLEFLKYVRPSQLVDVIEGMVGPENNGSIVVIGKTSYTIRSEDLPSLFNRLRYFIKVQGT